MGVVGYWILGNMEFYGSEATILTKAKLRSILLPNIHESHIARDHRLVFALLYVVFMVQTHWFMDTYIARFSLIIYYHSMFYCLGNGVTIVTSYCPIMMSDIMVAPE